MKGIEFFSNQRPCPLTRGDNYKIVKYINEIIKKNVLLQNHRTNINETWHEAFVCEEDYNLFKSWNEGPHPFLRVNYYEITKLQCWNLKKPSCTEPQGQFQWNLTQSILGWRRFKFVQMKDDAFSSGDIDTNKITKFKYLNQFQPNSAYSIKGGRELNVLQRFTNKTIQFSKKKRYNDF